MAKTTKGRVIYDRAPHLFKFSDVARVVRALSLPTDPAEAFSEAGAALAVMVAIASHFWGLLAKVLPQHKAFFALKLIAWAYQQIVMAMSEIPEFAGGAVQEVVDFLARGQEEVQDGESGPEGPVQQ